MGSFAPPENLKRKGHLMKNSISLGKGAKVAK